MVHLLAVDPAEGCDLVVAEVDVVVKFRTNEDGRENDPKAIVIKLTCAQSENLLSAGFLATTHIGTAARSAPALRLLARR
jgi:hypothetical protein